MPDKWFVAFSGVALSLVVILIVVFMEPEAVILNIPWDGKLVVEQVRAPFNTQEQSLIIVLLLMLFTIILFGLAFTVVYPEVQEARSRGE